MRKILLGSKSPRRAELLRNLGYRFEIAEINLEEDFPENLPVEEIAYYLAAKKANAFRNLEADEILITADTVVVNENRVLGKPESESDAVQMLLDLSGKTHKVFTGFSVKIQGSITTKSDVAEVIFDKISPEEAEYYVKNFKPLDKAGSYGIQEWLGMAKISAIKGSYYTIMGLPTHLLYNELRKFPALPQIH